jgi:TPR repeat protein
LTVNEPGTESKPSEKSASQEEKPSASAATTTNPSAAKPAPPTAASESNEQEDSTTKPVAKSKPAPVRETAAEPAPDPRTNKMLVLGEKYLYGRGVTRDCNQAMTYFRAAAGQENAPAMSHLGAMYASGSCVPIDRAAAYQWFARAENADPGNQWLARNLDMLWRDMTPRERAATNR